MCVLVDLQILDEHHDEKRIGVVMLLTDGLGITKEAMCPEELKKYPVHTFGICAHDPTILLSIAQLSCGTYSFIDNSELGKITDPFAILLGGLSSIVGVNVVVEIGWHVHWRSKITRIDCGFESSEIVQSSMHHGLHTAEIGIGMLYAGEVKNFVAHVQIDPDSTSGSSREWAEVLIRCKHARCEDSRRHLRTGKQAGNAGENSAMVRRQMVQFRVLEFLSNLLLTEFNIDKNNTGAEGDKEVSDAQIRTGSKLETWWAKFMETVDDDLHLDELQKEVQEMVRRLKQGDGMAYMCSWVSSQQMQRATTLGSVDTAGAHFFTDAMEMMLVESKKYHVEIPKGGAKLEQLKAAWDKRKQQAEDIEKAKDKDIEESIKCGECQDMCLQYPFISSGSMDHQHAHLSRSSYCYSGSSHYCWLLRLVSPFIFYCCHPNNSGETS